MCDLLKMLFFLVLAPIGFLVLIYLTDTILEKIYGKEPYGLQ